MSNKKLDETKRKAKEFAAFLTDVATAMQKHKVTDMVCIFGLNGDVRNTYLPLHEDGEHPLYCKISDAVNDWLKSSGAPISEKKFTGSITVPNTKE